MIINYPTIRQSDPCVSGKLLSGLGGAALAIYLGLGAYFYWRQDELVFVPTRVPFAEMAQKAEALGFQPWTNAR